jgi:hypothetical protein
MERFGCFDWVWYETSEARSDEKRYKEYSRASTVECERKYVVFFVSERIGPNNLNPK